MWHCRRKAGNIVQFSELRLSLIHVVFPVNLYRWETALEKSGTIPNVYCKGVRSEATRCPRSVAALDFPLLLVYFHGLTSYAFAGSSFLLQRWSVLSTIWRHLNFSNFVDTEFILPLLLSCHG